MTSVEATVARIAVMDDSQMMRRLLSSFLEHGGHTVQAWEPMSAMEIIEKVKDYQPDLLQRCQVNEIIHKPVTEAALLEAVERALAAPSS